MNALLRGLGSGFGRAIGRIVAYIFVGFVIYTLLKYFDIDISKIIDSVKGGAFYL